jgi:hypothetical protein
VDDESKGEALNEFTACEDCWYAHTKPEYKITIEEVGKRQFECLICYAAICKICKEDYHSYDCERYKVINT